MPAILDCRMLTSYRNVRSLRITSAVLTLVWFVVGAGSMQAQYVPHITQIDKQSFPLIKVFVSVTDEAGNPMPDDQPADLILYEDGNEVAKQNLSQGWAVSTVLVLDESGSMNDAEKLQRAKEAAVRYVEMAGLAGPQHEIALVVFNSNARVVAKLGTNRTALTAQIRRLSAQGGTALQDGIGLALDQLRGRTGRRVVVAMTDGIENSSRKFPGENGLKQLLDSAKADGISIFAVGVGHDVNDAYLRRYLETNGKYFFAPSASQLKSIFERAIKLIAKETMLQYTTASTDRDGMTARISLNLKVRNEVTTQESSYTKAGVIPHVRGNPLPYLLLCLFLLILPRTFTVTSQALSVVKMRVGSVHRLTAESEAIKKKLRDRNVPEEDEYRFKVSDLVIKCPAVGCPRVYYIRSWRYSECHCICDGEGRYCYTSLLPGWLRKTLDFISGGHSNETTGRSFLCRCMGDSDGY